MNPRRKGVESAHQVKAPALPKQPGARQQGGSPDATQTLCSLADAARLLHDAVKDKSYVATPIGLLVRRYLRWARNERGLVSNTTVRSYEYVLARMSITLAHLEPGEVTLDDLRTVIDFGADREPQRARSGTRRSREGTRRPLSSISSSLPAIRVSFPPSRLLKSTFLAEATGMFPRLRELRGWTMNRRWPRRITNETRKHARAGSSTCASRFRRESSSSAR